MMFQDYVATLTNYYELIVSTYKICFKIMNFMCELLCICGIRIGHHAVLDWGRRQAHLPPVCHFGLLWFCSLSLVCVLFSLTLDFLMSPNHKSNSSDAITLKNRKAITKKVEFATALKKKKTITMDVKIIIVKQLEKREMATNIGCALIWSLVVTILKDKDGIQSCEMFLIQIFSYMPTYSSGRLSWGAWLVAGPNPSWHRQMF